MAAAAALLLAAGVGAAERGQTFLAIGDWGGSVIPIWPTTKPERENAASMASVAGHAGGADFVLALGDNFYPLGVPNADSPRFESTFEKCFSQPELQVPWYVVAGNHDHYGNVSAQVAYSARSKRWNFPSLYYTFSKTFASGGRNVTTQVVYIDTVVLSGDSDYNEETGELVVPQGPADAAAAQTQLQWLEATLAASTADYLWVAGHYPIYSVCMHGPTQQLIDDVLPLMQKYRATGYISGHDHCLEHLEVGGMPLVLSGAGMECCYGARNLDKVPQGYLKWNITAENHAAVPGAKVPGGFASFSASAERTTITYHSAGDGRALYSAEVAPRKH